MKNRKRDTDDDIYRLRRPDTMSRQFLNNVQMNRDASFSDMN